MLLLTSTTDKIQVITSAAVGTHAQASWIDNNAGTITPGRTNTVISTAATTDVVASPAASTSRNIKQLTVRAKGGAQTVTVQHTDGTTVVELITVDLLVDQSLVFTDGLGFQVLNRNGQILGQGATGPTGPTGLQGIMGPFIRGDDGDDGAPAGAGFTSCMMTRAQLAPDARGWTFLGTATAAAVTVGPVIWPGTYTQFMVDYWIAGYNGGTPVGRLLFGGASISTTALTNGSGLSEGVTAPTAAQSIPGCPLAVTLSAIARSGTVFVRGASGALKTYEILGANGNASVTVARTLFRAAGSFSDLGTNLPLQRMQLSVYDDLVATALSAQAFTAGTYLSVWGRNND